MPETPWVPTVTKIKDGDEVRQAVINPIFDQLIQREQYLYEKFLEASDRSTLIAFDLPIHASELAPNPVEIASGKLSVVYFGKDSTSEGVRRGIATFATSQTKSTFSPANSAYSVGIVKDVSATNTVDVWIQGMVDFAVDIDDASYGLLDYVTGTTLETFRVGPYYLSRKSPGKLTSNPSGIAVFVGYAINKRKFLLSPNVDEFSQLFVNYRYNVLDRPTATPSFGSGAWTIPDSNINRLGWVDVNWLQANNPDALADKIIPTGAKFYYNIPAVFTADNADNTGSGSLTDFEETEASELAQLLPPHPSNFVTLTCNGIQQIFLDENTPDGVYTIDQFGLWWFDNTTDVPWAADLVYPWVPANWSTNKGAPELRPRLFLQFAKFNPTFRQILVTSIEPYKDVSNDSSVSVKLLDKYTGQPTTTGDIQFKFDPQFTVVTAANAPTAVSDVVYNASAGTFTKTVIPVVSQISSAGTEGVIVTETPTGSGKYVLSYQSQGIAGEVTAIEPENSDLHYLGLHSYLKLPAPSGSLQTGFVGKVVLPKKFPNNKDFKVVLHLFGLADAAGSNLNVGVDFEYVVSTALNSAAPASVITANSVPVTQKLIETTTSVQDIALPLTASYKAKQAIVINSNSLLIPAANIGEDSVVNFRITRKTLLTNHYNYDVGVLAVYWSIA